MDQRPQLRRTCKSAALGAWYSLTSFRQGDLMDRETYSAPTVTELGRLADAQLGGGPANDGDLGPASP